jgi:SAM-dependent methyltransferase
MAIRQPAKDAAPIKLLDYACGNGVASRVRHSWIIQGNWLTGQALASHVEIVRGIDISEAMVEGYNSMARASWEPDVMHAVQGDLLANDSFRPRELTNFDVAVISMALHHVSDAKELMSRLVARLRPDGVVVVLDWVPGAADQLLTHHHHSVHDTLAKSSFSKNEMFDIFTTAGCKATGMAYYEYKEPTHIPQNASGVDGGVEKTLFIAWAQRA